MKATLVLTSQNLVSQIQLAPFADAARTCAPHQLLTLQLPPDASLWPVFLHWPLFVYSALDDKTTHVESYSLAALLMLCIILVITAVIAGIHELYSFRYFDVYIIDLNGHRPSDIQYIGTRIYVKKRYC